MLRVEVEPSGAFPRGLIAGSTWRRRFVLGESDFSGASASHFGVPLFIAATRRGAPTPSRQVVDLFGLCAEVGKGERKRSSFSFVISLGSKGGCFF